MTIAEIDAALAGLKTGLSKALVEGRGVDALAMLDVRRRLEDERAERLSRLYEEALDHRG